MSTAPTYRLDATERDLIRRLQSLPLAPGPDPGFRTELRAQLVAVAPRLVAEGPVTLGRSRAAQSAITSPLPAAATTVGDDATAADHPTEVDGGSAPTPARSRRRRRPILVLGSVAAVVLLVIGGAVWLSGNSLPGDPLYRVKRAREDVGLSVTRGDDARGRVYLTYSQRRAQEAWSLIQRATSSALGPVTAEGSLSADSATLVTATLQESDADARNGARLLMTAAVQDVSTTRLTFLLGWTSTQRGALTTMLDRLPSGSARASATLSRTLVGTITTRATALRSQMKCACLSTARSDPLGPLPCTRCGPSSGAPSPRSSAPASSPPPTASGSSSPAPSVSSSNSSSPGTSTRSASPPSASPTSGAPTSGAPTSGAPTSGATTSGAPTSGATTSGATTTTTATTTAQPSLGGSPSGPSGTGPSSPPRTATGTASAPGGSHTPSAPATTPSVVTSTTPTCVLSVCRPSPPVHSSRPQLPTDVTVPNVPKVCLPHTDCGDGRTTPAGPVTTAAS